jgi:S-DNA-T family DNA segregation ATPase FtsK/SpoIIIE
MMRLLSFSSIDQIPDPVRDFLGKRLAELAGLIVLAFTTALALAFLTWSVQDPSLNHATSAPVRNLMGSPGAIVADLAMQMVGLASTALLVPLGFWGWRLFTHRRLERMGVRVLLWFVGVGFAAAFASILPVTDRWPLASGLGGVIGDALLTLPRNLSGGAGPIMLGTAVVIAIVALISLATSSGFFIHEEEESEEEVETSTRARNFDDDDRAGEPGWGLVSLGALIHAGLSTKAAIQRIFARRQVEPAMVPASGRVQMRQEPRFEDVGAVQPQQRAMRNGPLTPYVEEEEADDGLTPTRRITPPAPALKSGRRSAREAQASFFDKGAYELPALMLLAEAKKQSITKISEDALEQNARLLEGVLDDFGVKGEIINVRPGPVVTLYELEPAPGIKSSRVIGLADDIARSMSAISARVAVVQGRNAIGIELPNQKRETVFLRELLASEDFEKSKHKLAIALGKTIGGEPVIVDLARMPHLLVAGTTGSGKSVAINTMILSLLYRLKPEECRLIMVDPKMLELSVYDGIPHLLTPVVTDPKKAVVALKWAVREMEDRYKKMSKLGVRNIDGFNARVNEALAKGETITRTVHTGYDRETGEAIYEKEQMVLAVLPYIVVIVDEMADLMMVAGKDIEGAIQRLAQMARAAGIHLIMATQRPSVDVITGTIKANFPTRISFQVTSKIDSRTILGEQGAEQLLGQGDMLYMAGGGRISRVHGPFVSDHEVEKVVAHLKAQGAPQYLEAITADDEAEAEEGGFAAGTMDGEESGDLYDRAVAIVLRDRKCSTSYIQRRLSVGYNKAASLVERMEQEGLVSPANHAGKREILVGGGIDRGAFDPGADD